MLYLSYDYLFRSIKKTLDDWKYRLDLLNT